MKKLLLDFGMGIGFILLLIIGCDTATRAPSSQGGNNIDNGGVVAEATQEVATEVVPTPEPEKVQVSYLEYKTLGGVVVQEKKDDYTAYEGNNDGSLKVTYGDGTVKYIHSDYIITEKQEVVTPTPEPQSTTDEDKP